MSNSKWTDPSRCWWALLYSIFFAHALHSTFIRVWTAIRKHNYYHYHQSINQSIIVDVTNQKKKKTFSLTCGPLKVNGNQRTQISWSVRERIIKTWKTSFRIILYSPNVFSIRWIFTVTRYPDYVTLKNKQTIIIIITTTIPNPRYGQTTTTNVCF